MKSKNTKRAWLASVLSIVLCLTMLMGTTFAWFTDTASTGVNKIVAGNLDVKLHYSTDYNTWKEVGANTTIFSDKESDNTTNNLWEPGHVEVAYLKVENAGTLDLKYKLGTVIKENKTSTNVNNEPLDLSKYIKFGIIENPTAAYTDRAATVAAITEAHTLGTYSSKIYNLNDDATDMVFAVVAYMPDSVGNEANHLTTAGAPYINFELSVTATQLVSENDSFGNDYDLSAKLPESVQATYNPDGKEDLVIGDVINHEDSSGKDYAEASILASAQLTVAGSDTPIVAETELKLKVESSTETPNIAVAEGASKETYEISLVAVTAEGEKKVTSTQPITVKLQIGAGRTGVIDVYHNETKITNPAPVYNSTTGVLSFVTTNFSPFSIVEYRRYSEEEARALLDKGGVVDFNGGAMLNEIEGDNNYGANLREYTFKAGTTVKNLTLIGKSGASRWLHSEGDVTFENCVFDAPVYACHFDSGDGSLTFKNCRFTGWNAIGSSFDNVLFENCEFYHSGRNGMARIYTNTQFINCTFGDGMNIETGKTGLKFLIKNCTYSADKVTFYQSEGSTITYE